MAPALKAAQARTRGKRWLKRIVYGADGFIRAIPNVEFGLCHSENRPVLKDTRTEQNRRLD